MTGTTEVVVIGAGVSGLTTAACLLDSGVRVRILAAQPPAETTSAVAGALIGGQVPGDPDDPATVWNRTSVAEFTRLAEDTDTGVRMARGRMVMRTGDGIPPWARALSGFAACSVEDAAGFPVAFRFDSPVVNMPRYLNYLSDRISAAGAKIEVEPVASLGDLVGSASLVVNCAGLGSMDLAGDPRMMPVRGQHVIVDNPGLDEFFYERGTGPAVTYYIPHGHRLVLGGTIERGDDRTVADEAQISEILARCAAVEPRIAGAEVTGVDVGLRPGRSAVRLEFEDVGGLGVVHNYGHAGIGVALSWGCAMDVARLVTSAVS
ncbi:MAG TPA: FAD-dependent oxidoreductase [Micromonosporaceae bacterium]|jgi:D-amino-acid oxidase